MKKAIMSVLICLLILCGCSNNTNNYESERTYDDGYNAGYQDGFDDAYEEFINESDILVEQDDFQKTVVNLMYDHEYDVVEILLDYCPDAVEAALEDEFGVKEIAPIVDYLEELSNTVSGICEICGEPVCADEFYFPPDGIECAHHECVRGDDGENSYQIDKDK